MRLFMLFIFLSFFSILTIIPNANGLTEKEYAEYANKLYIGMVPLGNLADGISKTTNNIFLLNSNECENIANIYSDFFTNLEKFYRNINPPTELIKAHTRFVSALSTYIKSFYYMNKYCKTRNENDLEQSTNYVIQATELIDQVNEETINVKKKAGFK